MINEAEGDGAVDGGDARQAQLFSDEVLPQAELTVEEREQLRQDEAGFFIGRIRQQLGTAKPFTARRPCPGCGTTDAYIREAGGQDVVRCAGCGRVLYNAPRTETGRAPRTVTTLRRDIKPGQQARILERDHGRCLLCGAAGELTIGHLLSVENGVRVGASERHLYDDANLAAMCEACNLGLNRRSVSVRTYAVFMWRLLQAEIDLRPPSGRDPLD